MFGVPPLGGTFSRQRPHKGGTPNEMIDLTDFYNDGSHWICGRCESELTADVDPDKQSSMALAKWIDKTRRVLICPRCGLTEAVEKS